MGKPLSRPDCLRQNPKCFGKGEDEDGCIEDCYIPQRSIYDTVRINEQIDQGSASSTLGSGGGEAATLSNNSTLGVSGAFDARLTSSVSGSGKKLDERVIFDALKLSVDPQSLSPGDGGGSVSPSVSSCSSALGAAAGVTKRRHPGSEKKDNPNRQSWKSGISPGETVERCPEGVSLIACPPLPLPTASPTLLSPHSDSLVSSDPHTPSQIPTLSSLQPHPLLVPRPAQPPPHRQIQHAPALPQKIGCGPLKQGLMELPQWGHSVPIVAEMSGAAVAIAVDGLRSEREAPFLDPDHDTAPLLPPLVSPKPAPGPPSTERTWPRRLMGRRRTVSQGGVLHNLPILPPLPPLLAEHVSGDEELLCLLATPSPFLQLQGAVGPAGLSQGGGKEGMFAWTCQAEELSLCPTPELRLQEEWRVLQKLAELEEEGDSEGTMVQELERNSRGVKEQTDERSWEAMLRQVDSLWAGSTEDLLGWDSQHTGSLGRWPLLRPPAGFGGSQPPSGPGSELGSDDLVLELEKLNEEAKDDPDTSQPPPCPKGKDGDISSDSTQHCDPAGTQSCTDINTVGEKDEEDQSSPETEMDRPGVPGSDSVRESDSSGIYMSNPDYSGLSDHHEESDSDIGSAASLDREAEEAEKAWRGREGPEIQWDTPALNFPLPERPCSPKLEKCIAEELSVEVEHGCNQPSSKQRIAIEEGEDISEKAGESKEGRECSNDETPCKLTEGLPDPSAKIFPREGNVDLREQKMTNLPRTASTQAHTDSPLPLSPTKHHMQGFRLDGKDADAFVTTDSFVYLAVSALPPFSQDVKPSSLEGSTPPSPGVLPAPWPEESDFLSTDSFVYLAAPERHPLDLGGCVGEDSQDSESDESRSGVDFVLGSMAGDSDWDSDGSRPRSGSVSGLTRLQWNLWEELEPSILQGLFHDGQLEQRPNEAGGLDCGSVGQEGMEQEAVPSHHTQGNAESQVQALMVRFSETLEELEPWLDEQEAVMALLSPPAIAPETLKQQQDQLRLLRESVSEHQAHVSKVLQIGPQVAEMSAQDGEVVRHRFSNAEKRYLAIKEKVRDHGAALDKAVSQSSQFHDKMSTLLETLERVVQRLRQRPPVAVEVEKIQEQLAMHRAAGLEMDKLEPSYSALCNQGEELAVSAPSVDPAAQVVQLQLQRLRLLWDEIRQRAEERERKLLEVLSLSAKFWSEVEMFQCTIRDACEVVKELEGPGFDPFLIKQQMETNEAIRAEMDGLSEQLDVVQTLGADLISACGETDKQQVDKTMEEINITWASLSKMWTERTEKLEEALRSSLQYQDALQNMFCYLENAVSELRDMSTVGVDLSTVRQQVEQLKLYKVEVYKQQINMENLSHQGALLLKKMLDQTDRNKIQQPLTELRHLWDHLCDKIIQRQHQLEGALLALGQFQFALTELQSWLGQKHASLERPQPLSCDLRGIQMELAKHHVLKNEVLSRRPTVENLSTAGWELLESSLGEEASLLQGQLDKLNHSWDSLLIKAQEREKLLELSLKKAEDFHCELEECLQWLTQTESQLSANQPTGGLPETAREQLLQHRALQEQLAQRVDLYHRLLEQRETRLLSHGEGGDGVGVTQTLQKLNLLQNKWASLHGKMDKRTERLEDAVALATGFQASLQGCINWLIQAEQTLNMVPPPSLILNTVLLQTEQHKEFLTGVNTHKELVLALERAGSQLSEISLEQDVVLIRGLLLRVQARWDQLVQSSLDWKQRLDKARHTAEQFQDAWLELWEWLEEAEARLTLDLEIPTEPDQINLLLAEHKEFQKVLYSKRPVYYATVRSCWAIRDGATLPADTLKLGCLLGKIRDKWDRVCGRSVEKQQKLEEALLLSGQFAKALQCMVDWLHQVEPQLSEEQPVHGDLALVSHLMDSHKALQQELGRRASNVQALKCSAVELMDQGQDYTIWDQVQLRELSHSWDRVCALSVNKQTRLQQALKQAEEFRTEAQLLLTWLSGAEQALRLRGALPEEAEALRTMLHSHRELMQMLEEKRGGLNKVISMSEAILAQCHPDGITTIAHRVTVVRARFQEVLMWAKQHEQRLERALADLLNSTALLEDLLSWLQWAETSLAQQEAEPLPQDILQLKTLITEHQAFMEEVTRKQTDVDRLSKTYRRKSAENSSSQADRFRASEQCSSQWQQVWQLALDYQNKLNLALYRLEELEESTGFDFDMWRERFVRWLTYSKSHSLDLFRHVDTDQDGRITRHEFVEGILASNFPTSMHEMMAVADIFDQDGDGHIDYYQFVATLQHHRDECNLTSDNSRIEDEVIRKVVQCRCVRRFQVEQIGENKYKFRDFECTVRMLFGRVLVQVGSGWVHLDQFLLKYDPCRANTLASGMGRRVSRKRGADV